ncbi:MAG: ATP-dependent DNA helicase [Candidatus Thermoplasmatota archaeon]|nr:ATP-dependent DNA helicase [Candidatus Thermoplasmatota archaeon]
MRFPYPPRPHQRETLGLMERALEGGHLVLQAGTGSGKTVCALYAALTQAEEEDRVVLYLVRTNSQQRQVMLELRKLGPFGVALQGRQRLCLLAEDRHLGPGSADELSHFCRDRKEEVLAGKEGCRFFRGLLEGDGEAMRRWVQETHPTAEEARAHFRARDICPYELNKVLASQARVITAPYVYFFEPNLRRMLLETLARPPEDLLLIVDEAHNLPAYCRDVGSFRISAKAVERAEKELMDYGDPEVAEGVSAFDLLEIVAGGLRGLTAEYVIEEDGFLPPLALEGPLMQEFAITTSQLRGMLGSLAAAGEAIREVRRRTGSLPRSHTLGVAQNLLRWMTTEDVAYAKLILGGERPALHAYCLDPSWVAEPIRACHASLHMSGTLAPLEEYRDTLGLPPDTLLRAFPSPFPPENRRVVYRDHVTTRYQELHETPEAMARLRDEVRILLRDCRRNTLFLFPSYRLLESFLDLRRESRVPVFVERRGMDQAALMRSLDAFRRSTAALFAVVGGRVSEGLDFPDRELEVVVLVGIPYPKPTAALRALVRYYDWKFRKGWEYGVLAPTTRRLLQCMGRLIRSERDRGIAIILDHRAPLFKRALGPMVLTEDPSRAIWEHLNPPETVRVASP